jgi:hypothetical protein
MRSLFFIAFTILSTSAFAAETDKFYGSNSDVRTVLQFKVSGAAIEKVLPPGWQSVPVAAGAAAGANLNVVLIDQIMAKDAEDKPTDSIRYVVINAPSKKAGMQAGVGMVVSGLASGGTPGSYGVYLPAKTEVERKVRTDAAGVAKAEESWDFKGENGDALQVQLQYVRGVPVRATLETNTYSGAKPDFYRIYRFTQAADVVRSTATGTDRVQKLVFKASGPKLSPLFDGSEQLVAITSIPFYDRRIFLPGS